MTLPADFDKDLWFDPLTFQAIVGRSLAIGKYTDLFREDGFAKPKADLLAIPELHLSPSQPHLLPLPTLSGLQAGCSCLRRFLGR